MTSHRTTAYGQSYRNTKFKCSKPQGLHEWGLNFVFLSFKKCGYVTVITYAMGLCDEPPQYIFVRFVESHGT